MYSLIGQKPIISKLIENWAREMVKFSGPDVVSPCAGPLYLFSKFILVKT